MTSTRSVYVFGLALGLAFSASFLGHAANRQATAPAPAPQGPGRQGGRGAAPAAAPTPKQLIEGTDKDDTLTGGDGDDWIFGMKGNDFLQGAKGRDKIDGAEGNDTIDGGSDADVIDGAAGDDTIRGGDGDDTIEGGDEADLIDAGPGVDDVDGGDGNDVIRGGSGNDKLVGGDENDSIEGGAGDDYVAGEDGADTLDGGAGSDVLVGSEGDDNLSGGSGDDRLDGGVDNDVLRGGLGNDTLMGAIGADTLQGGDGHDILIGSDGSDSLSGGLGSDWILGGPDADSIAGNEGDDLIILRAGDVGAGEIETINGGSGTDVLILTGFTRRPGPLFPGTAGTQPNGEQQLVDPVTGGIYRLINVERVEYTQLAAEVAPGAERRVSILLLNPSSTATTGRVLFFGADGSIVRAASGSQPAGDDLAFTVPATGSLRVETTVRGPVSAQIFSSAPLGAVTRGLVTSGSAALGEVPMVDSVAVPVLENRATGVGTGVLITNGLAPSTIKLTLFSLAGEEMDGDVFFGMKELEVPAYGHRVVFVRDLFPRLTDFQGAMLVDGGDTDRPQEGGPLGVVALERNAAGRVAMSPAVTVIPMIKSQPVHVAGISTSGDSLVLLNPSVKGQRALGTLRFFDEAGRPWSVSVNRQAPATTVTYDIGPMGSAVFTLSGTGAAQRGTARAEPTQGALGGVVRVASSDGNVTRIPASEAFTSFIAAVRRDRASSTTSRLSVSSTGTAVTLRLTLRSAAGAAITGGTAEIRLAENGHATRTLEQLFPSASTDTFDGTLTVVADGGTVAASAAEIGAAAVPAVVLPVVPLP